VLVGRHLPPGFDADLRRVSVQVRDQDGANDLEELAFLVNPSLP
jgi:hypothetical protein